MARTLVRAMCSVGRPEFEGCPPWMEEGRQRASRTPHGGRGRAAAAAGDGCAQAIMSRESGGTVVVEGCAADGGREVVVRCGRHDRLIDCTLSASASREGVCRGQRALDCARFIVQTWKETSSIIRC
jgi:hypothetical protein